MSKGVKIGAGVLVLLLGGLVAWAPAELEVNCHVGGALTGPPRCTFTNTGPLPGRQCVVVHVESPTRHIWAAPTCSGMVWPWGENTRMINGFTVNPAAICSEAGWDNCQLRVEGH